MQHEELRRANISEDVANRIRNMIVDARLEPGCRINEVHLARELGVSRTPLREAIAQLVRDGTLTAIPRIGSFVRPLSIEEFEQIYPIRSLLDPEALRLAGIPPRSQIDQLQKLNVRITAAKDADTIIALDDEWHLRLIANCPNAILVDLIRDFIRRTRRYELALMREQGNVAVATGQHDAILAALRAGDLARAVAALRENLQSGFAPIRRWLEEKEAR